MSSATGKSFLLTVIQALRQSALFNGSSKKAWHSRCVSSCLVLTASQVGPSFTVPRRRPLLHDLQLLPLPLSSLLKYGVIGSNNTFTKQDDATAEMSEYLQSEKEVYRCLYHDDDIASCLDLSGEGIQLALMENGKLQELPGQTQNTSRPVPPTRLVPGHGSRPRPRPRPSRSRCRHCDPELSPLRRPRCQAIRL